MSFLEKNLAALRVVMPKLADAIQEAAIPSGYEAVTGTDGTPTFRRLIDHNGKNRLEWLGATSMPRASAAPMIRSLDAVSAGQNGLGLSIGTGYEWAAFAARLPRAQMVYVYEPDPAVLRMALMICDLSGLLATCRIVLLTGAAERAAEELSHFLAGRDGLEVPAVLHPLPTLIGERRNELLTAGEAIVRRAVSERQALVADLWQRVSVAGVPTGASGKAALAFLLTPRYAHERPLHASLSADTPRIVIDRHDSASTALRLRKLVDVRAQGREVTIISDLLRPQLGALPEAVPVETWVPPLAGPAYWQRLPAGMPTTDRVVVHFGYHAQCLQDAGIAPAQIILRPLLPVRTTTAASDVPPELQLRHRVVMIGDLSPTDVASLGIELPTHQSVFAAATELVKADYLTVHPGMAPDLLRRALARAGVDAKADDPALKDPMLRLLRDVLIPSLPPLVLAGEVAALGVALTLIGDWPGLDRHVRTTSPEQLQRIPFEAYASSKWQDVALLMHLSPEGTFSPLLWEAITSGTTLISPQHPTDRNQGSLPTLLAPDQHFAHPAANNLLATVKSLLRDAPRRTRLADAARRI